jgi:hypothetical protein
MAVSNDAAKVEFYPERIDHEAITHMLQRIFALCRRSGRGATAGHLQTAGIGRAPAGRHIPCKGV